MQNLENSLEKVYDKVCFSTAASLQCRDCNFTLNRLHHKFFLEYVSKSNCLKKNIFRKSVVLPKTELTSDFSEEAPMYLQENLLGGSFFPVELQV